MLLILNVAQVLNGFVFICIWLNSCHQYVHDLVIFLALMSSPIQQAQLMSITSFDTL